MALLSPLHPPPHGAVEPPSSSAHGVVEPPSTKPLAAASGTAEKHGPTSHLIPAAVPDGSHPFFVHVASYCTQHKNGAAVEAVTKFLGLLSPAFCLAATLSHGDTSDSLLELINNYIDRNLHVVDPAKIPFAPTHDREIEFQQLVLEICYVKDTGQNRDGTQRLKVGEAKRRAEAAEFLDFSMHHGPMSSA